MKTTIKLHDPTVKFANGNRAEDRDAHATLRTSLNVGMVLYGPDRHPTPTLVGQKSSGKFVTHPPQILGRLPWR